MRWQIPSWRKRAVLYVHFPCFDGVISGVLTTLFLESTRHWKFKTVKPVNYQLQTQWIQTDLPRHSAVVDFLYHPGAEFWADHHVTTFVTEELRRSFESSDGASHFYDRTSRSCASLLLARAGALLGPDQRLEEMVWWAEKIDSAAYESAEEALFGSAPALVLNRSMAIDADQNYCELLITSLRQASLGEVSNISQVRARYNRALELGTLGLERVRQAIALEGEVAVFDVNTEGALVDRYSAYHPDLYPKARYSVGVSRSEKSVSITAMRNPWLDFQSVNLGEFMRRFGGGGHQRVGSVMLPEARREEALQIVNAVAHLCNAGVGVKV